MSKNKEPPEISEIPESYQRYLDTIFNISKKKKGGWVTNKEIAENLQVEPASVSGMLEKLKKKRLINWEPRKLEETHALLRIFFKDILKIDDEEIVEKVSCEIEHHITRDVKDSFRNFILKYHK